MKRGRARGLGAATWAAPSPAAKFSAVSPSPAARFGAGLGPSPASLAARAFLCPEPMQFTPRTARRAFMRRFRWGRVDPFLLSAVGSAARCAGPAA